MKKNCEKHMYETENPDKVKVVETYEVDRYEPKVYNCQEECESTIEEIKECCKIYVPRGDYSNLTTFEINYDDLTGKTLEEDREIFQKKLDEAFGKDMYEAFVLGAYIHSGTAFSVNKTGNHVCRFDSSQLGFIGLRKGVDDYYSAEHPDHVADMLTAAWEGQFNEYFVYDNLVGDMTYDEQGEPENLITADYDTARTFCDKMKEKYGVDFDNTQVIY